MELYINKLIYDNTFEILIIYRSIYWFIINDSLVIIIHWYKYINSVTMQTLSELKVKKKEEKLLEKERLRKMKEMQGLA